MANSGFILTNAGLADMNASSPDGPYFKIVSFKLGSAHNYIPTAGDTALHGTVLFTGTPTAFTHTTTTLPNDTLDIMLECPNQYGDFLFGEIGIYGPGDVLYAICSFDSLMQKVKAVGNQAGNIFRFHAYIRMGSANPVVEVESLTAVNVKEYADWPALTNPTADPAELKNAAIVLQANASEHSVFLYKATNTRWSIPGYRRVYQASATSYTTTSITHASFGALNLPGLPSTDSRFLVQFSDGKIRRIVSRSGNTLTWNGALPSTPSGTVRIYVEDAVEIADLYSNKAPLVHTHTTADISDISDIASHTKFANISYANNTPSANRIRFTLAAGTWTTFKNGQTVRNDAALTLSTVIGATLGVTVQSNLQNPTTSFLICEVLNTGAGTKHLMICRDSIANINQLRTGFVNTSTLNATADSATAFYSTGAGAGLTAAPVHVRGRIYGTFDTTSEYFTAISKFESVDGVDEVYQTSLRHYRETHIQDGALNKSDYIMFGDAGTYLHCFQLRSNSSNDFTDDILTWMQEDGTLLNYNINDNSNLGDFVRVDFALGKGSLFRIYQTGGTNDNQTVQLTMISIGMIGVKLHSSSDNENSDVHYMFTRI